MSGEPFFAEEEAEMDRNLPRSLVPRLHCLFARRVRRDAVDHPLLPPPLASASAAAQVASAEEAEALFAARLAAAGLTAHAVRVEVAAGLRDKLVAFLARGATRGDAFAAEYLLLHLLSRVRRSSSDPASATARVPIGTVPLNLVVGAAEEGSGAGAAHFASRLGATLASLAPACHVQPLDGASLSARPFAPRKDYTLNRLCSGVLQLSAGTVIVLDETKLRPGALDGPRVAKVIAQGVLAGAPPGQIRQCRYEFHRGGDWDCTTATLFCVCRKEKNS